MRSLFSLAFRNKLVLYGFRVPAVHSRDDFGGVESVSVLHWRTLLQVCGDAPCKITSQLHHYCERMLMG